METVPTIQTAAVDGLLDELVAVRSEMVRLAAHLRDSLSATHPDQRRSAENLVHYIALRQRDMRDLQDQLTVQGLSSLGRSESHVLANVDAVISLLHLVAGDQSARAGAVDRDEAPVDFLEGNRLLGRNTLQLFGDQPKGRCTYIMVTLPGSAACDVGLCEEMLEAGMDIARINCAHDDADAWRDMVHNIRSAAERLGKRCQILMDLAGPKLRTGAIGGPKPVLKWKPRRARDGRVVSPARLWLTDKPEIEPPVPVDAVVPIVAKWFTELQTGDRIKLRDCRGKPRTVRISASTEAGFGGECDRTGYVVEGMPVERIGSKAPGAIGRIAGSRSWITLYRGDHLVVTDDSQPGNPAVYDDRGRLIRKAQIGCTLPEVFADVKKGERILFDDGRIGAIIEEVHDSYLEVVVKQARASGEKLYADKGINLPDTELSLGALTEKDIRDLVFVAEHADMVGYSFVRRAADVHQVQEALTRLGRRDLGLVLKIENRQAFENLPVLLLEAMRSRSVGVMIARGDLAVEIGYERLAEVQEEIVWLCEAAHTPAIWATQVLEGLAKEGVPTRAEITDAAMGVRAECVMLNKGPFIVQTVRTLGDILARMAGHQVKKRPQMRRLHLAGERLAPRSTPEPA